MLVYAEVFDNLNVSSTKRVKSVAIPVIQYRIEMFLGKFLIFNFRFFFDLTNRGSLILASLAPLIFRIF